jgi:hypothetical protein
MPVHRGSSQARTRPHPTQAVVAERDCPPNRGKTQHPGPTHRSADWSSEPTRRVSARLALAGEWFGANGIDCSSQHAARSLTTPRGELSASGQSSWPPQGTVVAATGKAHSRQHGLRDRGRTESAICSLNAGAPRVSQNAQELDAARVPPKPVPGDGYEPVPTIGTVATPTQVH